MSAAARPLPYLNAPSLALIDIGTFKTVCMIIVADSSSLCGWRIAGVGHQVSRGVKARVVMQVEEAEDALRAAVLQAERMAGVAVEDAVVSYGGGRLKLLPFVSRTRAAAAAAHVDDATVMAGQRVADEQGLAALLFDVTGPEAPMTARVFAVDEGPLKTLLHVVERADLKVAGVVPAALTSALAVTSADERAHGITVVDLGAGATTAALFLDGHLQAAVSVPVGGQHMTFDIARELQVPTIEAERIKLECGIRTRAQSFVHGALQRSVPPSINDGSLDHEGATISNQRVKSLLSERTGSLFALLADRIAASGVPAQAMGAMVLTGGVSQMAGLDARASGLFGVPVRTGRPSDPCGMFVDSLLVPAFATAIGTGAGLTGLGCGRWAVPHSAGPMQDFRNLRESGGAPWAQSGKARLTVKDYAR